MALRASPVGVPGVDPLADVVDFGGSRVVVVEVVAAVDESRHQLIHYVNRQTGYSAVFGAKYKEY